jgi:hypothetical protein
MTIRNEAMISRYFDRMMSPGEEQNFLISLAASNELRLAFRSQLELMKAIRDDKHDMRPIAEVRSRTLMALGLTGAVTAPFLEQALLHEDAQAASEFVSSVQSSSFFSQLGGKLVLAGSGIAAGFLAAALFFSQPTTAPQSEQHLNQPATQTSPTTTTQPAVSSPHQSTATQTVQAPVRSNAVHNRLSTTLVQHSAALTDSVTTSTPASVSTDRHQEHGASIKTDVQHDSSAK